MTKEDLIKQIEELDEILNQTQNKKQELVKELKEVLIKESGLEVGKQYLSDKGEKIWIVSLKLNPPFYEINAITNKVKKDGTNGLQRHNSWGYDIDKIKPLPKD